MAKWRKTEKRQEQVNERSKSNKHFKWTCGLKLCYYNLKFLKKIKRFVSDCNAKIAKTLNTKRLRPRAFLALLTIQRKAFVIESWLVEMRAIWIRSS